MLYGGKMRAVEDELMFLLVTSANDVFSGRENSITFCSFLGSQGRIPLFSLLLKCLAWRCAQNIHNVEVLFDNVYIARKNEWK